MGSGGWPALAMGWDGRARAEGERRWLRRLAQDRYAL